MNPAEVVRAVRSVVGAGKVDLHVPHIGPEEAACVSDCVAGGVIGYGYVDRVQTLCAELCGAEQTVAVTNGTAALHLACLVAGVEPGSEVLMPALTFVATANAAVYCGAVPNFVDTLDLNVAPFKLRQYLGRIVERRDNRAWNRITDRRISAMIAVDLLGHPCAIDDIRSATSYYDIPVIEDAAEALGSRDSSSRPCGGRSHIGVLSFNNNKIVTGNGGGMVLTNDAFMAAHVWNLATTARVPHPWLVAHSETAWNYRMSNLTAALIYPQLRRLDELVAMKRALFEKYQKAFAGVAGVELVHEPIGCRSNYWLNAIALDPREMHRRDELLTALHADGIDSRALFTPLFELPMYKRCPRDNLEGSIYAWKRTICLPSSPKLGAP